MVGGIVDGVSARGDGGEVQLDGGLGSYATGSGGAGGAIRGRWPVLCTIGVDRLVRSWACQMSQCSAVQSVSGRRAWSRGVGGSVGSASVVCSLQMCGDGGRKELGGLSRVEWS